jgi:septum formation protein
MPESGVPRVQLTLASGSPRRAWLLGTLGIPFKIEPTGVDEGVDPRWYPREAVMKVAKHKAEACLAAADQATIVVAADTMIVHEGHILGKPRDLDDAASTLRRLSGSWHQVITGVVVATRDECRWTVVSSAVKMRSPQAKELDAYVQSGDPLGRAGSYGVHGPGAFLVESVRGCVNSVSGLPLCEVVALARLWGQVEVPPEGICLTRDGLPCPRLTRHCHYGSPLSRSFPKAR